MLDYGLLAYYRSFQIVAALERPNGTACNRPVTQAVRERMEQELERVFRLLGLIHPSADVHNSYLSLKSYRPQLQANALEVLEHLSPPEPSGEGGPAEERRAV